MALFLLAGLQMIPGTSMSSDRRWRQQMAAVLADHAAIARPALLVALIFRTLDAFNVFDVVFVMKGVALDTIRSPSTPGRR